MHSPEFVNWNPSEHFTHCPFEFVFKQFTCRQNPLFSMNRGGEHISQSPFFVYF